MRDVPTETFEVMCELEDAMEGRDRHGTGHKFEVADVGSKRQEERERREREV
jgi:hypothetical protein